MIIIMIIIIINILFVPHSKTKQYHKLQINLESVIYIYRLNASAEKK